jgi:hypothetical protein
MKRIIRFGSIAALALAGSLIPAAAHASPKVDSGTYFLYPAEENPPSYALTENGVGSRVTLSANPTQIGFVAPSQGGRVLDGENDYYPFIYRSLDESYANDYVIYLQAYGTHDCLSWDSSNDNVAYGSCVYTGADLWVQHGDYYVNVGASDNDDYPFLMGVMTLTGNTTVSVAPLNDPGWYFGWDNDGT